MNTILAVTFWMLIGGKFSDGLTHPNVGDVGLGVFDTKEKCEEAAQMIMKNHPDDRAICVEGTYHP